VARERWFARQKEMGLIAPDAELAPRNPGVEARDDLAEQSAPVSPPDSRRPFAGPSWTHTDDQIGRLMDDLERLGELDNTVDRRPAPADRGQPGGRTVRRCSTR
jgi:arylsulfatase